MSVLINDQYRDCNIRSLPALGGFDYVEDIDYDDLRIVGKYDVKLVRRVEEWIEGQCAGNAMLCTEGDFFKVAFNDPTDAMAFHVWYIGK